MKLTPRKYNLTIISRRMPHHSAFSGYDRLADYLEGDVISQPRRWTASMRVVARMFKPLINNSGCQWYHREGLICELSTMRRWLVSRNRIFHFLYGENSFRYLGAMKSTGIKNRIVCTYHTPPGKFMQGIKKREFLRHIDGLIVVSTIQQEYFSKIIGEDRVFYIPHGVDIEHYKPIGRNNPERKMFECLFVGSHLRDMNTLSEAANKLQTIAPDVHITVVTSRKYSSIFDKLTNVDASVGIDDAKLLNHYQTADIFLLPLLECTANNGLLEAMSCGLPIISTDLQGVKDYVNDDCAILTQKGNVEELIDVLLGVSGNQKKLASMARASRMQAKSFSWKIIAEKTSQLYGSLL